MRIASVSFVVAALVAIAPLAAAAPGPYGGFVTQGQTRTHVYFNDLVCQGRSNVEYTVTLETSATDVLRLTAGGRVAYSDLGATAVTFWKSPCARFEIHVYGFRVAEMAPYTVSVTSSPVA